MMRLTLLIFSAAFALGAEALPAAPAPDFNRDIRPILSDKCIRCHGPDDENRKGGQNGLRLDTAAGAREDLGGGAFAIVPGHPGKSELIARITTTDDDELMPPRKSGKTLSPAEIDLLKRWIESGGAYARHWSYEPPKRSAVPAVKNFNWPRGAVDKFVLAGLEAARLSPQPEADRAALARRVALDLTGLPPTLAEVEALIEDRAPEAYERFVDRQLAKPAYGEHWARAWLDLARYADSKGYADDQTRSIWRYRDWVIDAFNRNIPFDQFTTEQIAGDLLPGATQAQLFATGFHRNTMTNTEGGTDDEEFRSAAVVDRVNTTMSVWMGTSMACAQCHTHKYDPLTHKEYFQLYAIFNQTEDADRADEAPVLEFYSDEQQRKRGEAEGEIARLDEKLRAARPAHVAKTEAWAKSFPRELAWTTPRVVAAKSSGGAKVETLADGRVLVAAGKKKDTTTVELADLGAEPITALRLTALPHAALPGGGAGAGKEGNFLVSRVRVAVKPAEPVRRGRHVRIEFPGANRVLALAEVEVFAAGENVAGRGTATQSTTAEGAVAQRAIDGRSDGVPEKASVSVTENGEAPWWEVDLGTTHAIERIMVWGRTGLEPTPAGLRIVVLDEARQPVWEQAAKAAPKPSLAFNPGEPRELKISRTAADYAQTDHDEMMVGAEPDARPAAQRRRKPATAKRGWGVAGATAEPHALTLEPEQPIALASGETLVVTIEQQSEVAGATLNHFRLNATSDRRAHEHLSVPPALMAALRRPAAERSADEAAQLLDYYVRQVAPELRPERTRLATLQRTLEEMALQTSPIMRELPADKLRKTNIQLRGSHLALGDEVGPGVPAVFPPLPAGAKPDRLALARWLVSAENPLTARVLANRLWESIFGLGLVRTSEEFGSQGEPPSHPELLDWLALELVQDGWDQKKFLRMLVTSAAYRQSSRVTPAALEADPENRLVSRGPRFRLTAEMVRDQALAVSGLLNAKTHGPSARPYQPAFGLNAAFGSALDWKTSAGDERHRRGLYTEWRRSSPYPSMVTFDAPNREVCTLRRNRSNTPLQALVTLNDPVYVEAAQALARAMMERGGSPEEIVRTGFHRVLLRAPSKAELQPLLALQREARTAYDRAPEQAAAAIANAENPPPATLAPVELAAWIAVANVLLNLDETLMKR
ncbi:MAG: DUF1553 domain-containing protein [Opitutaceae bacterium]|nr:DUF1553 domain-containing protein [Opitutaceae bacterium]